MLRKYSETYYAVVDATGALMLSIELSINPQDAEGAWLCVPHHPVKLWVTRCGLPSSGLVSLEISKTQDQKAIITKSNRIPKMQRVLFVAARIIQQSMQEGGFRYRVAFITTTSRPGTEWEARHISELMDRYRKWCRCRGAEIRSVRVMETTRAGKPHYHIALFLPRLRAG